ncbi:MAG TPA: HAD family hydrolase [Candidatus Baltobacteraceae bacterium]|jgi:phosphoglycolate phosphatase|nr:HAD family hydrolase [Candidatus Baltobacteraceae bacterium]
MIPRSLILDLDGTLIDSRPGILDSFAVAANAVYPGLEFDPGKVVLGPPVRQMFQVLFPEAGEVEIEKLFRAFREHYDREGSLKTQLYDGARELLSLCDQRGIDLYIATNKPAHVTSAIVAHFKIDRYFRSVLAVDSVEPPFPSKTAIIRHLLRENDVDILATFYVGDSVEDAMAAAQCGIRFIWAAYGYGKLDAGAPTTPFGAIKTLGELARFLG